jgi:hypothetical protein
MFSLAAMPLSKLESSPSRKPVETTPANSSLPADPANFPSTSTFGGNTNRLPPGVPLPPGAQFSPGGQSDPSSSQPNTRYPGFAGTPHTPGAASNWSIINSPNGSPTPTDNFPSSVTCVSASECWAVGYYNNRGTYQTLIERWDGTSWSIVDSPNTGATQHNLLRGVTCASASECWAVGSYYNGSFQQTLIERWDGTSWSIVDSPNTSDTQYNYLFGVTCMPASECWAVGYYHTGSIYQTLIERWDGTSWTVVTSPNIGPAQNNFLNGVTCVSTSDCWAVGNYTTNTINAEQTLIERWNGTSWTIVTSANTLPTDNNYLLNVTCASASDCWAVGYYNNGIADQTLLERWNGTSWAVVSSPNTLITQANRLLSVTCASASECWAVGYYNAGVAQTLIERWNGTSWVIVTSPNTDVLQENQLWGVTCAAASDCWAVGYSRVDTLQQTLLERWNGTAWIIVASPNKNAAQNNTLLGVTCVSASDCWAVASYFNGSVQQTLIERWDGTSWTIVTSPNTSASQNNILYDVSCVSGSECWTIGYYLADLAWQTLIERWDGISWTIVTSPSTGPAQNNFLNSVTCASSSECWAVGFYDTGSAYQTLIERWNGISWTIVASPNTSATQENRLFGVTCASASDCWAVGRYVLPSGYAQTLIERWDGTSWTIVTSPNTSATEENYLWDVTCASASDCWAVGSYGSGSGTGHTLIERWDGTTWAIVASPNPTPSPLNYNFLKGVTCTSASECWAVGYHFTNGAYRTLIERWDGTAWAIVNSPNTSATQYNFLIGVTCTSASDCWAVGYHYDDSGIIRTLTEHYAASLPPTPTSIVSRKTHGPVGDFDIELPLTGAPGIECRTGGASGDHTVIFTFPNPLATVGSASVTTGVGSVSSSAIGADAHEYVVNLTGVANAQTITVTLFDVSDGTNTGDVEIQMSVLLGDTNGNGSVSASDIGQAKAQSGLPVSASNFRTDVNVNGTVNASDISLVKSKSGTALP